MKDKPIKKVKMGTKTIGSKNELATANNSGPKAAHRPQPMEDMRKGGRKKY